MRSFGDLAAAGRGGRIRADLARAVDDRAFILWDQAKPPASGPAAHPWAAAGGDIRVDDKGNTLVPMRDTGGRLWSVHVVGPDGSVSARVGRESRAGLFHVVGDRRQFARGGPLIIAADHASATVLHRATGHPVACAMDDEALPPVAEALRRRYGKREIIVAATDTHMAQNNRSLALAKSATKAVGGKLLRPPLDDAAKKNGLTTFGDLAAANAGEAIMDAIAEAGLELRGRRPTRKQGPEQDL